ncbi:MAG TPA: molecular chaperone Hsp33 [Rhodospirillaceae bacterium]|nr:molecular chaperone Hsp33 [Rhodospirillaceae bacterium]HAA93830.1 molecular chaperone Hsp33 [Rhodospirillaceae bacterium]HAT36510.1 molecular chaperone Hsp33 [Rhodospirillaceae bacterium]
MHVVADGAVAPEDDFILPFLLDAPELHGRLVRLGPAIDEIIRRHDYPVHVGRLLAEALTLTALLSAALKFEGVFTFQTKGDGPVSLLVCDATESGALRGYAKVDHARIPEGAASETPVSDLLGEGYLALTVDQGDEMDRYQGIVELDGQTLEECVHHYFRQSQQFQAAVKIAVAGGGTSPWRSGAMMLQRLPADEEAIEAEEKNEAWQRAMVVLADSDPSQFYQVEASPFDLLYDLFEQDGVRVFESKAARAECRCSKSRVELVLASLSDEEIEDLKVDGKITVTCEFCNREIAVDEIDLAVLRKA